MFKTSITSVSNAAKEGFVKLSGLPVIGHVIGATVATKNTIAAILPVSHNRKLFVQAMSSAALVIFVSSLTPGGTFVSTAKGYSAEYMNSYAIDGDILVTDEEGYLVKINPQTDDSNRIGLSDFAVHTVESGESLSVIAAKYNVGINSIKWENGISNTHSIRAGQKLSIPPVDGISYKVKSGDSVEKVATKYNITADALIAQNGFDAEVTLGAGQNIFLPGAKPIVSAPIASTTGSRNYTYSRDTRAVDYSSIPSNTTSPTGGKMFIYPTRGGITQGYHAGHYAIDIGDRSKPPIWAPAGGNVVKVSVGSWGGGYGNHVIVDHGNGLRSLYAHMDSVNVVNGQWVNQGDVIGIMGNTGRVYGVTGIHLHWEVIDNGVKRNPALYY